MSAAANTTVQYSHEENPYLNASVENVCIWLEHNDLDEYCGLFRDYQIDELMLFTDNCISELLCRNMTNANDRGKFVQAREELLNRRVQEPQTLEPEIASANSSREDVEIIVTNNFIRYGHNNQEVMTGDARVVNIRQGVYTAADLCKKWLDNHPPGREMINPKHVKIVKNVQWRHKSLISPSAEAGDLIFPADFDGNLPTVIATAQNLRYYDCSFADETQVKISLSIEHTARVYTYNPNYVQEWVIAKNGPGLERHDFTHFDMPHSTDNGWFVLGKFNDQRETELHLTAFVIPAERTLLIGPNIIHSNDYLQGEWRTMLAGGDIDRVLLKRQRHAGMALQPFAFDFPDPIPVIDSSTTATTTTANGNNHPAASPELFSGGGTLLSAEHQRKLNEFYGCSEQKWELIYKGTRDGFHAQDFHRSCDNSEREKATITVVQSTEDSGSRYLFGGCTSISWTSNYQWKKDPDAFLFTLTNPYPEVGATKLPIRSDETRNAVSHDIHFGPWFGEHNKTSWWGLKNNSGGDIVIVSKSNESTNRSHIQFPSTYVDTTGKGSKLFTGSNTFVASEIEIYLVTKYSPRFQMAVHSEELFLGGKLLSLQHQHKLNELYNGGKSPHQNWKLIYKASRDGVGPNNFHEYCDNKGLATMIVIQSLKGYLYGGYTSVPWSSDGSFKADPTAFLFTLYNPHQIPPTKLNIKTGCSNFAIYHYKKNAGNHIYGPSFGGNRLWDCDIAIVYPIVLGPRYLRAFIFFPVTYEDTTGKGPLLFTGERAPVIYDYEVYIAS